MKLAKFIDSFFPWFIDSMLQWFIDLLTHWIVEPLVHWIVDSLISLTHWIVEPLIQWFIHPFTLSFVHSLTHSLIHSTIHSSRHCCIPSLLQFMKYFLFSSATFFHSFTSSKNYFTHSFVIFSCICPLTSSFLIHSFVRSFVPSFVRSCSHSFIEPINQSTNQPINMSIHSGFLLLRTPSQIYSNSSQIPIGALLPIITSCFRNFCPGACRALLVCTELSLNIGLECHYKYHNNIA